MLLLRFFIEITAFTIVIL